MSNADSKDVIRRNILGYRNYKSDKKEFFKEDFESLEVLREFLEEMFTGESDITGIGREFLLQRLRSSDAAQRVMDLGGVRILNVKTAQELIGAVERQKPHEIAMFIAEAKENQNNKQMQGSETAQRGTQKTDKDIVRLIRGTGGAARILGGINVVFSGFLYVFALLGDGQIPVSYHLTSVAGILIGCALFVVGHRVYVIPDHSQKDGIYKIIILSFLMLLIGITNKTFPFFFLMLVFFGINTLWRLKKHGPITNLSEVLAELKRPTMTEAERKAQKKVVNRNTWKTVGLAVGIVFALFAALIVFAALFPEKFETDTEPTTIHTSDPDIV